MFQFGHLELSCKMKVPQVQDEKFKAENSTRHRLFVRQVLVLRLWIWNLFGHPSTGWLITEHQLNYSAPCGMHPLMAESNVFKCGNWLGSLYARVWCDSLGPHWLLWLQLTGAYFLFLGGLLECGCVICVVVLSAFMLNLRKPFLVNVKVQKIT